MWHLVLIVLSLIFLILLGVFIISFRKEIVEKGLIIGGLNKTLFLILMPKYPSSKETEKPQEEKMMIAQMEQVLANFLYLKKPKFFQPPPSIALEIASQLGGNDISFFVAVPRHLENVFEKYVHGVYPHAIVDKVPQDYTIFEPRGVTAGAYLKLSQHFLFPLSTYQVLEKDPLSVLTNSLSKIAENEGAAIQYILKPAWKVKVRKKGEKVLKKMREGKSASAAVRSGGAFEVLSDIMSELSRLFSFESSKDKGQVKAESQQEEGVDQKSYEAIQNKIQKQSFEVNIRVVSSASTSERAEEILDHILAGFTQYSLSAINSLEPKKVYGRELKKLIYDFSFRNFNPAQSNILNLEEIASLYHFPTHYIETPYIKAIKSISAPPPEDLPERGDLCIGEVIFRGERKKVYLANKSDRRRHFYIVGQTGVGKSVFIEGMAIQDIKNGEGVGVIDPHGDLIERILGHIPEERIEDVVLFEPFDTEKPCGLNMLEYKTPEQKDFAVQEMIAIFMKLFPPEYIGPMFEHYMRNAMLAVMADKDEPGTLVEIPRMFTDPQFLEEKMKKVTDPVVRQFWLKEWAQTVGTTRSDMLGWVISKLGRFIENEMMRNIIGQSHSGFDLEKIMDEKKIFLANLSKGLTGEVNSALLGLILVSKMQMAAMRRARIPEEERKDFYLYVDEFQNFTTDSVATILSEARKYKLNLIIAHQYMPQLRQEIRDAVLGNVGTIGAFRIGAEDAENLEKQFEPVFSRFDLVNLDNFNMIIKMMINNKISAPFKMRTLPTPPGDLQRAEMVKKASKRKYGRPKNIVEEEIIRRSRLFVD